MNEIVESAPLVWGLALSPFVSASHVFILAEVSIDLPGKTASVSCTPDCTASVDDMVAAVIAAGFKASAPVA